MLDGETGSSPPHLPLNPIASLIRQGAEDACRRQGFARATSKVRQMISSLRWRQAHSQDDLYPLQMDSGLTLKLKQLQAGEVTGLGTGATVWPAAHVLAKYIERRYGENGLHKKRVVDLGSGTGAVGIMAAALGATVVLTDEEQLLHLMRKNAEACIETCRGIEWADLRTEVFRWGDQPDGFDTPWDMVLVSDCVLPKLYPIEPLVDAIDKLSGPETVTLLSYEHRYFGSFDPRRKFEELARTRGLAKTIIPISQHHPAICAEDIEIWEVRRIQTHGRESSRGWEQSKTGNGNDDVEAECTSGDDNCLTVRHSRGKSQVLHASLLGEQHDLGQDLSASIGSYLWPSSVVVARYLLASRSAYGKGTALLELGSGIGLVAITAALLGWNVVSTDKADAISLLEANTKRCLSSTRREGAGCVEVLQFEWGSDCGPLLETSALQKRGGASEYSVIICSDCVYALTSVGPLLDTLRTVCTPETKIFVVNELRSSFDEFLQAARQYFRIEDMAVSESDMVVDEARNERPRSITMKCLRLRRHDSPF